ncbi:phage tail length tape measure family protein [Sphingomonas sp. PAMC 26621]|uniref:phage tail length tape measure family protein n=1 Tax=Sphingomonas sp. PAMC 26621 TaxID=1112213 RepID=UPI0002899DBD|nr:phage tail length tape measure family protein [Sphingomonas sp. PAMC 26621]
MADQTERLLLQVDAATELLRRNLAEGEKPLDRFEKRAAKMAENVDGSISNMGKRFSAFAELADTAATRAQKSFEASFSQVQRLAATAIKGPTIDGGINLGADDIRAGAAAAQDQARAFALIGEAAERAAAAERDTSEATRLFIQATNASRIEAEQKAAALLAEAGALERVEIELRQSAEATELFVTKHQRIAEAAAEQQRLSTATAETAREQKALGASADALRASIDPMYAAQQRFDAELTRAETLLSAGTISTREYDAAVRVATAALQAHAATVTGVVEQDRLLAASAEEAARGQRALAAAADIVRAELDPMFLAQKRFDDELNRADSLLAAGAIHQREYAAAVEQARANLYAHAQSVAGSGSGTKALSTNTNALRYAMQGLSYQVQDTFTQLSMGANVLQVVAIQGGQTAGQFANLEGKAGSFARFMIGPWGLAITGALLILGPLTKGMFEFSDATNDAVEKLKKDAIESDVTARAKARFAGTVEGLTGALKDQDKALRQTADSERSSAERANIAARAKRDEALAIRQTTVARLAEAEARLGDFSSTGGTTGAAALQNQARSDQVNKLKAERTKAEAAVTAAEHQLNVTRVDLAAEQAATSIDPVRSVTKAIDDKISALKNELRTQARLGQVVGAESLKRLRELEAQKKAATDLAQANQRAANAKPNNNQIGREVNVAEATSIIAGIGGHVTSGLRSNERQAQLYADKLAGRHAGPVAKPGTSDHERGQAIDVAYGPGISVASIRQAFAKEGVAIRQLIDERDQKVFHVAFGKKGPNQQTVDSQAERARQKVLNDDIAYSQEEQQARQRLTAATRKSAQTEDQRDAELVASINAEADSRKQKIDLQQDKGMSKARADNLRSLNEQTRTQELQNAAADRATRVIEQRYNVDKQNLESQVALLRISEDMAPTERDRRRIAEQILEAEQTLRRQALERVRDTSKDPEAVMSAQRSLSALPALEGAERGQLARQNASPLDAYRDRLKSATADTNAALQGVAVNALGSLESSVSSSIGKVLKLKGAFGEMASSIIADLARIAIEKAIVSVIGSPLGFANGGSLGGIPGRADGGSLGGLISGPGHGRSDSILALLSGPGGGAVRLSNREFIMNEGAVNYYGASAMAAINARRLPRFANGGSLGGSPSLPNLRAPRLPAAAYGAGASRRMQLDGNITVSPSPEFDAKIEGVTLRTVGATAEPIMAGATARTMRKLNRPELPGGFD